MCLCVEYEIECVRLGGGFLIGHHFWAGWVELLGVVVSPETWLFESESFHCYAPSIWFGRDEVILKFKKVVGVDATWFTFDRESYVFWLANYTSSRAARSILVADPNQINWHLSGSWTLCCYFNTYWKVCVHFIFEITNVGIVITFYKGII